MQEIFFGENSIEELKKILEKHKPRKIFLVTGKKSYELCGAKEKIENILDRYNHIRFSGFSPNPKIEDVEIGLKIYRENNSDFVIAIGGGSVIDMAKLINIFSVNRDKPVRYIKKERKIENKGNLLVAIPTTSGTGSESTHFAVVYTGKEKHSLGYKEYILPDYAIIDPQFTMNLSRKITAETGMDALGQAIESYWCINSTNESKDYAREAINIIMSSLEKATNNPNKKSRAGMAKASNLAGRAINITKTTASHSLSYPITSYFGISHGQAVGITIPSMIVFNAGVSESDVLDTRGVKYVKKTMKEVIDLLGCNSPEGASLKITELMRSIGLETRLNDIGVKTAKDIEIIIKNGFTPDRVKNNPRKVTEKDAKEILEGIF